MSPPIIAVRPAAGLSQRRRLFSALETAFEVSFTADDGRVQPDALIVLDDELPAADALAGAAVPTFAASGTLPVSGAEEDSDLLDAPGVDRRLRRVTLAAQVIATPLGALRAGETVLARTASGPVWVCAAEPFAIHRVAVGLPELGPDQVLRGPVRSAGTSHALALIALTHFLRAINGYGHRRHPPVKAAMQFDDPNLRRPTYGFIDYAAMLRHADEHNYHVAMAMIPLDALGAHRATIRLFKSRPDRLSVIVHGNNHVRGELSTPKDSTTARALAAQALRRIMRFEARTGLAIDRVMVPPHGLCSLEMAQALAAVGFDALSALHPLPWLEEPPADRMLAGWEAASFAGACAVVPRMPFHALAAEIAIHAFLDHPIVLYGHHKDMAGGLDVLAEAAARVNAIDGARWGSLGRIAEGNYGLHVEDGTAVVAPLSGRLVVDVPDTATRISVRPPRDESASFAGWIDGHGELVAFDRPRPCDPGSTVGLRLRPVDAVDPREVPAPRIQPWPILRRVATELRDRALRHRPRVGSFPI